jgi:hypothetical protein
VAPLDARGILDGIRRQLSDYTVPGPRLHPPRAIGTLRLPTGATITPPSLGGIGLGVGQAPVTRLWPFLVREAGVGFEAIAVSPPFNGPARLMDVMLRWSASGGSPNPFFSILVSSDSGGGGGNQPVPIVVPGDSIFETPSSTTDGGDVYTTERAFHDLVNAWGGNMTARFPLGKDIPLPRFYLKARLRSQALGATIVSGLLRLVEGFDPLICGCPQ